MNTKRHSPNVARSQEIDAGRRDVLRAGASMAALATASAGLLVAIDEAQAEIPTEEVHRPAELARLIDAHRAAEAEAARVFDIRWDLDEASGYKGSSVPGYAAAKAAHAAAADVEAVALEHLLAYRPTSFGEVRQMIDHLTSDNCFGTTFFPDEQQIGMIFAALSTSGVNPYACE